MPGYLVFRNPLAAHNTAVLASFVLAFVSIYALARHLTTSKAGAAAAGIAFAFCPYVLAHTAHIQLMMTAGLPLTLLAIHRYVDRRTAARAATLGAVIAAQGLSCAYYGILAGLLAAAGIFFFAFSRRLWRERSFWLSAAGAVLIATTIVVPFFLQHRRRSMPAGLHERSTMPPGG